MYLTIIYSPFSFVTFAADHTPPYWFTFLFCGRYYSCKITFLPAFLRCCHHQGGPILYVAFNISLINLQPVLLNFMLNFLFYISPKYNYRIENCDIQ
jgi:hypothetical protein